MKKGFIAGSLLCLAAAAVPAQESDLQALKRQIKESTEAFQKAIEQQRQVIESLNQKIKAIEAQQASVTNHLTEPKKTAATAPNTVPGADAASTPETSAPLPWSPTAPIRMLGGSQNYIDLSFDGLFAAGTSTSDDIEGLQLGGHDPNQRGFTIQNLETTFEGKVDPYFRGQANIILQIDSEGETVVEVEEAYLESLSLPGNLQLKGGQFFSEFGRLNPTHPHSWDFVDLPLVNGRFFGGDGLRSAGGRLSWLTPTPFYSELYLAIQNGQGETAHSFRNEHEGEPFFGRLHEQRRVKAFNDLLFVPRYATSFELTDEQTLLLGASAALGPNGTGSHENTQIYGLDLFWKWKPVTHHAGFPFVSWQTEAMFRRFGAGAFTEDLNGNGVIDAGEPDLNEDGVANSIPRETLKDYGGYSQFSYGFRKGWVASLRGDFVRPTEQAKYESIYGTDPERDERWRISPALTWFPSEFSKIRLQYNYDRRLHIGEDHSIWLQMEFLLGAHAGHKF